MNKSTKVQKLVEDLFDKILIMELLNEDDASTVCDEIEKTLLTMLRKRGLIK